MRVLLVWPHGYDTEYVMPLSLGYLKSNTPKRHPVKLLDCSLHHIRADSAEFRKQLKRFKPDLVGVSAWSPTYNESIEIFRVAKEYDPKIITVMGGAHATAYPDLIMKNKLVDYLFLGEAELSFPDFLDELEKGKGARDLSGIKGLVMRKADGTLEKHDMERQDDLDKIKIPDYKAMDLPAYLAKGYRFNTSYKMNAPVWVTRGCPYRCAFCSAPQINGRAIRAHSTAYMKKWVKYLNEEFGIIQFNIIDDNFTFNIDYAKEFCAAFISEGRSDLHFGTPNGIRMQRLDDELLAMMKKAGWENLIVAPESGSRKTLKRMVKGIDPDIVPGIVERIKAAGLKVHGFFMIGYPGETPEDIAETVELLRKCKFNFFFLNNFQPLPGTPVYNELVELGEIPPNFLPKNYSDGQRSYTPEALKDYNFPKLVLREYARLAITNPANILYMVKLVSPGLMARKVMANMKNMVVGKAAEDTRPKAAVS
ncbi:MAG: radical SAM protein [Nanoarchaeota archaeon]